MDKLYLAAICAVTPGLGRRKLPALLRRLGGARAVFEAGEAALLAAGVKPGAAAAFTANRRPELPQEIERFCRLQGVRLLSYWDEEYPELLRQTPDPPLVLYVQGVLPHAGYACAVVGSRSCTGYGKRAAAYFAADLAARGIPIISGGARGIDTAAHEAALQAGGATVAVMGCGLDIAYPEENAGLFRRIVHGGGALLSEFAPGTPPAAYHFPARNRIIAGMANGVLVAEAAGRSGALITANIAADEGRDVYCVPGNIFDRTSFGCHELIRTGAKLVDGPQDILDDIAAWKASGKCVSQPSIFAYRESEQETSAPETGRLPASPLGRRLLELLQEGAAALEELTAQSGGDFAAVSMELLELQAAGLAAVDQAGRYYRR